MQLRQAFEKCRTREAILSFVGRCDELCVHDLLLDLHDENSVRKPFYRAQAENTYTGPGKYTITLKHNLFECVNPFTSIKGQ